MTAQKSFAVSELSVGMRSSYAKTLSKSDVATFAELSGDNNPVHVDEEFAATTMFRGCIAHGMLTGALLSTVIGTQLPGVGTIYLSQSLRFKAWQRASCIFWAVHDAYNAQRRMYAKIYGAYDPETGFDVKQNDPFKDHQQLNIKLVYEPVKAQGMRAKVGTVNCPESSRNTCRIASRGLAGQQGPHLRLDINLSPEHEATQ